MNRKKNRYKTVERAEHVHNGMCPSVRSKRRLYQLTTVTIHSAYRMEIV